MTRCPSFKKRRPETSRSPWSRRISRRLKTSFHPILKEQGCPGFMATLRKSSEHRSLQRPVSPGHDRLPKRPGYQKNVFFESTVQLIQRSAFASPATPNIRGTAPASITCAANEWLLLLKIWPSDSFKPGSISSFPVAKIATVG